MRATTKSRELRRGRAAVLLAVGFAALAGVAFATYRYQSSADDRAVRAYVARVGPPARQLYRSWNAFQASIGRAEGSDELAVKASYDTATGLKALLEEITPPPEARLFHHEMTDVVNNVLKVIDARVRLALTGPEPNASGVITNPEQQRRLVQLEAGNAFYVAKQTFPDAMAQLGALESG